MYIYIFIYFYVHTCVYMILDNKPSIQCIYWWRTGPNVSFTLPRAVVESPPGENLECHPQNYRWLVVSKAKKSVPGAVPKELAWLANVDPISWLEREKKIAWLFFRRGPRTIAKLVNIPPITTRGPLAIISFTIYSPFVNHHLPLFIMIYPVLLMSQWGL